MKLKHILTVVCATLALTSCFDKDYDLEDIDLTLQLGPTDGVFWTPKNDIDSLMLINVMNLDDDDIVKVVWDKGERDSVFCISADGDDHMYAVWFAGDEVMTIDNQRSDPMKMDNRPDCLNGDSVCLDMYNAMLCAECENDCDVDIDVVMEYFSWRDGEICASLVTPSINVKANATTKKYFSEKEERPDLLPDRYMGYEWVQLDIDRLLCLKVNRGGKMVPVAPDSITSVARRVTLTRPEGVTEARGNITLSYSVYAPFRFDDNFCIFYEEEADGWYSDLNDLEEVAIHEVVCTADVINGFPLNLRLDLTPTDLDGNPIPGLLVTTPHAKADATTPIEFSIRSKDGGALNRFIDGSPNFQQLDGVKMSLRLASDGHESHRPVHKDASLRMVNIRLGVRGGVIIDGNDD